MLKLNKRRNAILSFIQNNQPVSTSQIGRYLTHDWEETVSRATIIRDINELLRVKAIKRRGAGRGARYSESLENTLLKHIDVNGYFARELEQRTIAFPRFNFKIFSALNDSLFSRQELKELTDTNINYQKNASSLSPVILKKELERLTIELSWKSSQIEGNTYSLIDTEVLIKENKEAAGHTKEEATMILNHKQALDYAVSNKSFFKKITLRQIENMHRLIISGLNINYGLRKNLVGITGTNYRPLDNQYQIREAMEKLTAGINRAKQPLAKALMAALMISYIQPFEDGNKRTARLLANAILLAFDYCPLSYRGINESDYKKALILFYEQNSAVFFKALFVEQFKFAVDSYFRGNAGAKTEG
ncbi:hypothetical protein A3G56_02985 [Candidatus Falkowbacteria bacterium RIFCSPLOWO2_12_FULL_45_10]|uniref:Fido domain-containing protein n=1 Tax=Candidatus Falkowbacteria bacterium RIFCSPLOWO2_12_FULL_45_10 TaxID=1797990 RepID=A0A1F5RZN8_9BACT|nr:MAG: hypothetical protein A3G56_02985 [Candidatus Falkowbacteria bacterium RIFCSPLOWO2_12_FULL_45_10]